MIDKVKSQKSKVKSTIKNSKVFKSFLFIFSFFLLPFTLTCYAASVGQNINAANRLYEKGKLDEALQKYNAVSLSMPDSDIVNFNMGAALYKKQDYQKAQDAFTKALTSGNKKIEADALYNIGNCKYKLGKLQENTDLSATVGLLRESLDYYKRAIELEQKNTDARFNHEFVERELKVLLDKLKQQKPQEGKQNKQQQQQQEKQGSQAQSQQQEQKQQEKGKESSQQQQQAQEEKQTNQQDEQKQQEAAQKGSQEEKAGNKELSEEGARNLLERYGREEATPNYMDKQTQQSYDSQVSKDW